MTDRLELKLPEGVEGSLTMVAAKNPQMFVLTVPGRLERFQLNAIRDHWDMLTAGTALAGKKLVVLDQGMTLQIVDQVPKKPKSVFATPEDVAAFERDMMLVKVGPVEWSSTPVAQIYDSPKEPYVGLHGDVR